MDIKEEERVEKAIAEFKKGKMVILMDDEDRENEGDLCIAAEKVTPAAINFMAKYGRGLICLAITEELARRLELPPMVSPNTSLYGTAFTVPIEARYGVKTGISAYDRATTILKAVSDDAKPEDFVKPGHVFPVKARPGGVLQRTGQTEGSVDLARLAGLKPAAVICEIMKDDGSMARRPDLEKFAKKWGLMLLTITDLISYRIQKESLISKKLETELWLSISGAEGPFKGIIYESKVSPLQYLALVKGEISEDEAILCRVHTGCIIGDVFGARMCDCEIQLRESLKMIQREGKGVFLYIPPNPHQLVSEASLYSEKNLKKTKTEAELREYGLGAQILRELGVKRLRLITNNPKKIVGLQGYGLKIIDRVLIEASLTKENIYYLRDKMENQGHIFPLAKFERAFKNGGK
jgi:3,4-dihydroxy 2-butanone 4-phosphate synthase/GTP cyclohydrolase II